MPVRKRPVRQSLQGKHMRKAIVRCRRRPAGRWNDRNAGCRFGRGIAAAPRVQVQVPSGQRGAGARACSARGAEGSARDQIASRHTATIPRRTLSGSFEAARANDEAAFTAALPACRIRRLCRTTACLLGHAEGRSAPARRAPRRCRRRARRRCWPPSRRSTMPQSRARQLTLLYGSPQIVDMLLAAGADPNRPATKDASRWSSCLIAISSSRSA